VLSLEQSTISTAVEFPVICVGRWKTRCSASARHFCR
jgi:hypothetical protein